MSEFSLVFPFLSPLLPLHLEFSLLRHQNEFVNKTVMIQRNHPFFTDMILVMFVFCSFWALVSCFRRHQQHKHTPFCVSQCCGGFLHCSSSVFCKALLLASELPTFSERLSLWAGTSHFLVRWSTFLSIVGIVELWFLDGHFCFVFFLLHRTCASTYLAIHHLDEKLFVFL